MNPKGSFAILDVSDGSVKRNGHVPASVIERIVGVPLDTSAMKPAAYPQAPEFDEWLGQDLSPEELRRKVQEFLFP